MFDSAIIEPVTDISDLFDSFKQGGFIVVFSEPTGYARVVANVEDAGFEVRDCLHIQVGESPNGQPATHLLSVLARKPFTGTVIQNVLTNGVGGLNIDGCRIGTADTRSPASKTALGLMNDDAWLPQVVMAGSASGRFPANTFLVHDWRCMNECLQGCPVKGLNGQSGKSKAGKPSDVRGKGGIWAEGDGVPCGPQYGDAGGASRFFMNFRWAPNDTGLLPVSLLDYVQRLISPVGGSVFRNV